MADEYIRKKDAVNMFNRAVQDVGILDADDIEIVFGMLSPADVASVVFCKDCRKRRKDGYCTKFIQNISGIASAWYMPQDDDFCSYGERREG